MSNKKQISAREIYEQLDPDFAERMKAIIRERVERYERAARAYRVAHIWASAVKPQGDQGCQ